MAACAALPRGRRHRTHFRALPYAEVGAALEAVRASDAWVGIRLCLEFVALTATRSGEARRARWPEIDRDRETWTVPAERMKAGREHRVPLSSGALAVLDQAREIENGLGLIFPSFKGLESRSPPVAGVFRDLGFPSTVHGLRSSFRDWAAETGVDRTVAEAALAHTVGGVEGAYFRSDLFEHRSERCVAPLRQEHYISAVPREPISSACRNLRSGGSKPCWARNSHLRRARRPCFSFSRWPLP